MAVMEQWAADQHQAAPASTSAAMAAAQMPFLALLQGAGVVVEDEDGRKRNAAFACDLDLLDSCVTQAAAGHASAPATRRRKRPRPRARATATPPPEKRRKPEEAETQRMTHIAVERNRRRLMNDHLANLRSLIPSSYIPRAMAAVGGHVRVRVAGRRWPGRLVRAVAALEDLRLAVLHLAVTSVAHDAVVYCFNLKSTTPI
nr:unnamed protein product [Digitaria exilis]